MLKSEARILKFINVYPEEHNIVYHGSQEGTGRSAREYTAANGVYILTPISFSKSVVIVKHLLVKVGSGKGMRVRIERYSLHV